MPHTPVLLKEVIEILNPQPGEFFIDGTIDGGGHAAEIIKKLEPGGVLLGIDWDEQMARECNSKFKVQSSKLRKIILEQGNYADLPGILEKYHLSKADGLLLDLGFSSEQLENSGRGFSFQKDEPLLMVYDPTRKPVKDILKEVSGDELAGIIRKFGGEKFAKRVSRAVKNQLRFGEIKTSKQLAEIIKEAVPKAYERGRIHPATRTFQALRIYANNELGNLEKLLKNLPKILKKEGRAAIISYHSLEDRLVKNEFRNLAIENAAKILTKKPISPTPGEIKINPRSRSAKLRAVIMQD